MQISSLLRIHPRFMRSVHLERDFRDPDSSLGYILTPIAQQALERITAGFRTNSTQRAWRIAGDYGSGKTDFALAMARIAEGSRNELPTDLRRFVGQTTFGAVLATGDNEPLGVTVLRALGVKSEGRRGRPDTEEVLEAVRKRVNIAQSSRHAGLLLILDELGKNLEYAARNPESDDVFLLQRLAEEATRSGNKAFVIVVTLHQGIAAYATGLDSAAKREWDKIAGRFEEIVYAQPIEQVAALIAATLNVETARIPDALRRESGSAMTTALKAGIYGPSAPVSLTDLGPKIFPIHPTTLPVLVRTMRQFGQNERSLFSFVSSSEPMSLQQHAAHPVDIAGHFRIHHLFDYVRLNLLPTITTGHSHTHWGVIEAVLASTEVATPTEDAVLKTVAMLSLLGSPDLPATEEIVGASVGGERRAVHEAINALRSRGVIYERGTIKGLCLWPHTSVILDELFAKAIEAVSNKGDGIKQLCDHVRSEHLVPRAFYARNGTLRYAAVSLIPATDLNELLAKQPQLDGVGADLNLRVILPADRAQQRIAKQTLHDRRNTLTKGLFVAVAEPPDLAVSALTDLVAWEWVVRNTPQLAGDRYAREEVSRQINQARRNLRIRLGGLDNLALPTGKRIELFYNGTSSPKELATGRELLTFLGDRCRRIYSESPMVLNELINRHSPSGAAISARTKLAEAMATASEKPYLGMDETKRPPEMALYLSILKKGGFHTETKSGWMFQIPTPDNDECKLLPAISLITETLKAKGTDALIPVREIFNALSLPPFGVREGLQPLIMAIYLATHHQHVALYEDGTYLHEVGGNVFLRLTKEPEFFCLQYCELTGVRSEVFTKLLRLLQIDARDASRTDLIDLVRPLAIFIGREIPEYSRKTNNLPAVTVAVRRALIEGREPVKLVFTTLPEACGLPPIGKDGLRTPDELAVRLRTALHEIRTAYPKLIERLRNAIDAAFDITTQTSKGRSIIAGRAAQLAVTVTEPAIKVFALRLADTALDDRGWVESIANLLARKSPERWLDNDETEFHHQLELAAARFKRTEMALIGTTRKLNGHACRIAITKSDGSEVGDLVDWNGMDESRIRPVENEIQQILSKHGRHGLAAAMRAIWTELNAIEKKKS
ncbi:hypothetical protein IMCC26134_12300 [Verrucomicrobia bacterium IMCC26134]|nr:hypothetical protein IMCC26134_12300 [Verrucomicrobia bacterium IMCC26134]